MKRLRYIIVCSVCVILCLALWPRFYVRSTFDPYVTILSNPREAIIYFGRRTIGQSGSLVGILLTRLVQIYPQSFDTRDDLILIHIKGDGAIQNVDMRNFGFSGSIFPLSGSIYYIRGAANGSGPKIWRLEDSTFVELDDAKASAVKGSFNFTSDVIKAGGWKEERIGFDGKETNSAIPLGIGKCVLGLTQQWKNGNIVQTVTIHGEGIDMPERILAVQDGKSKSLSKADYIKEIPKQ